MEKEQCEQKLAAIQKELPDEEKRGVQGVERLTAETLQQYVKRIEIVPNKQVCMELLEGW